MSHSRDAKHEQPEPFRFLGYGLPPNKRDVESRVFLGDGFELHDEPLRSPISYLDYDGVIVFAGAYDKVRDAEWGEREVVCVAPADLDRREREFFSVLEKGKPFIFLVSNIPAQISNRTVSSKLDLFRRIVNTFGLDWECLDKPFPLLQIKAPEFKDYLSRYGTGYVTFSWTGDGKGLVTPLFVGSRSVFGAVLLGKVFLVPCTFPQTHDEIIETAKAAIHAALRYRTRTSKALPEWVASFVFGQEASLRDKLSDLHKEIAVVEPEIDQYTALKGALCFQSDPLVEVIVSVLGRFFGISITVDEKCIEDGTLLDENSEILAVFEIKGVKRNFTRSNVNQVDSHRERLELASTTPGVLIMNTVMSAQSLTEKDQAPHPDIIKKAVADNVLIIRTLDLLRYADAVEKGVVDRDSLLGTILTESGWLKVENDTPEVVKG